MGNILMYNALWYAIFREDENIPFEVYASERVAREEVSKMNRAHKGEEVYEVKQVCIEVKYPE